MSTATVPDPSPQPPAPAPLNPEATPFLPAISSLPTLSDAALTATLDLLFEPSAELHALALPTARAVSFDSYDDLVTTLRAQLLDLAAAVQDDPAARARLHAILGSHPRLGEPRTEALSSLSRDEQRHLREREGEQQQQQEEEEEEEEGGRRGQSRDGGSSKDGEELARLNREYEARFPGLRYVVFVNGRGRAEVMADMRRRIDRGDAQEEEREAIRAMCDIAADRARKLLRSAGQAAGNSRG